MSNPKVTLSMLLIGVAPPLRAALVFIAQIVAGIAAAAVVDGLFYTPLKVSTTLSPGTSLVQGVFIEMFLTAQLVFVILMLAVEKHKATFLAPIGIGLALFICHMVGVFYTGASLNPARSFGPSVVTGFHSEDWVYWVGPFLGTLVAYTFYRLMKFAEYETANPGQDNTELVPVLTGTEDDRLTTAHSDATTSQTRQGDGVEGLNSSHPTGVGNFGHAADTVQSP
jgi:aquaporin related protein